MDTQQQIQDFYNKWVNMLDLSEDWQKQFKSELNTLLSTQEEQIKALQIKIELLNDECDAHVKAKLESQQSEWISVKDRLPKSGYDVIVYDEFDAVRTGYYDSVLKDWYYTGQSDLSDNSPIYPDFWQYLPKVPNNL